MNKKNWYIVILAGGKGERLWPLSTANTPKQILPFKEGKSLLQTTIQRALGLVPKEQLWIITSEQQKELITAHVQDSVGTILAEPAARNTAAAILYTCLTIHEQNPDAVIAFLPADHYIEHEQLFIHDLEKAVARAHMHNSIVLIGIKPTFGATGYGYIECAPSADEHHFYPVISFHEKPSAEVAQQYCKKKNMLWNAGIFCANANIFIQEFMLHAPKIYVMVSSALHNPEAYKAVENISIDHAIMEKSKKTELLPATFSWSDVGNLDIFLSLVGKQQNNVANVVALESANNLVYSDKKQIALLGVNNLCIVEAGDRLLVADRGQVEKIKKIIENLKQ
jgi:mannose-1-phosphate guanylyltransferase